MNLEAPAVVVDLDRGRHLEPVAVDEALPGLGGEPQGLPLSRELADRIAAAEPHRNLSQKLEQEVHQNESTADYLETRGAQLHRPAGRELRTCVVTGTCRRPRDRRHSRGRPSARRSAALLPPLAGRRRVDRLARRFRSTSRRTRWCRRSTRAASASSGSRSRCRTSRTRTLPGAASNPRARRARTSTST